MPEETAWFLLVGVLPMFVALDAIVITVEGLCGPPRATRAPLQR
ncbi:hypothetical protein WJ542_29735 [Paraburkholderia sp. B3]